MKKTLTINLNQHIYHIDEDAYNMLSEYLDSLNEILAEDDSREEIITDIENRIGEICNERINNNQQVVTVDDITEIITRLGRPEQFDINSDETATPPEFAINTKHQSIPSDTPQCPTGSSAPRRLYRDIHNKMIGGVCSGIGAYISIDPTWIRLLFIALAFFYGTTMIIYIILWIVIPPAITVTSQIRMAGMQPTMENIGRAINQAYTTARDTVNTPESRSLLHRLCNAIISVVAIIFKVILAIMLIVAVPLLTLTCIALVIAAIGLIITCLGGDAIFASTILLPFFDMPEHTAQPLPILITIIGTTLTIGVPIFALVWGIGRNIFNKNTPVFTQTTTMILLVLWGIGIALTCYGNILVHCHF